MKKNIVSFLLCFCIAASLLSGMTPSALAEETAVPAVESISSAFPSGEGGERSETEEVSESLPLEGKVDAAQPQTDEVDFLPVVEDIPVASAVAEDGKTIDVLRETSPALRAPSPKGRAEAVESLSASPIETAPAEEVVAELQASGTCGDNLTWTLDYAGALTISGTGAMTNWIWDSDVPWYSDIIKNVTIGSGVTSIGRNAFSDCTSLTSVTIPDSVTSIGDRAFCDCTSLTSVTIPDSVTSIGDRAFYNCTILTSIEVSENNAAYSSQDGVLFNKDKTTLIQYPGGKSGAYTIPDSVTSIGSYAFYYCRSLTSVTIPDSVTSIGYGAFSNCNMLEIVFFRGNKAKWNAISVGSSNGALTGAIVVTAEDGDVVATGSCGDNLTWSLDRNLHLSISGTGAMTNWSPTAPWHSYDGSIKTVTISSGVTSIGDYAFQACNNLTSITIGDSVTSIGTSAFYACRSLTSITIPDSVKSIGNAAFESCGLISIAIGSGVTNAENAWLYACGNLMNISVSKDNAMYVSQDGVLFNKNKTTLIQYPCGRIGAYAIPDTVTAISDYAFWYCDSLTSVAIPDSVTSIEDLAFCGCDSLTSVIYCGSQAQWNKISIGSYNDPLKNAARQYHNWDNGQVTTAATCTKAGTKTYTCTACGTYRSESISALGHSWDSGCVTSAAACSETGVMTYTCITCNANKTETIPALGHDYTRVGGVEPTCLDGGWEALTCSRCSDNLYQTYEALGHKAVHHNAKAVTCEAIGWDAYDTCSRCDYSTYSEIPALGHNYIASVTTAATCEKDGVLIYTCQNNNSHRYTEPIPSLGHNMELTQRVAPSKEADGLEVLLCSRCQKTEYTTLPKLGVDPGDLNGDGVRNSKDVTSTRRYLAGGYSIALANELIADTNKDGVVNAKDVTILRRYLADGYGVVLD